MRDFERRKGYFSIFDMSCICWEKACSLLRYIKHMRDRQNGRRRSEQMGDSNNIYNNGLNHIRLLYFSQQSISHPYMSRIDLGIKSTSWYIHDDQECAMPSYIADNEWSIVTNDKNT